jgi:uncharacterized protein (DUF305 family)
MYRMPTSSVLLCLGLVACSPSSQVPKEETPVDSMAMADMGGMNMMMPAPGDTDATRGYKQAMMGSMQKTPPFTGDADRDFMQQMRVHHLAAIQMSETLLRHGKDQQTRTLAQEIIKAQQREIGEIDDWLASRR